MQHFLRSDVEFVKDIAKMGNNLNQLARLANISGFPIVADAATVLIAQIKDVVQAMLHPGVKWPVGHICISFHPDDAPMLTNDLMVELCEAWMKGMGISDTQYLLVRHYDTKHPHMHLVFNRINDYGELISDKMWYVRNERVCKEIKRRYGLTFSPGKQNVNLDRLRTSDRRRYQMYLDVKSALGEAKSFAEF